MTTSRKRKRLDNTDQNDQSRKVSKVSPAGFVGSAVDQKPVQHVVLSSYYPKILTLRDFLLSKLPLSSRVRRRKITTLGREDRANTPDLHFLDTTFIGVLQETKPAAEQERQKDFIVYTQSQQRSSSG